MFTLGWLCNGKHTPQFRNSNCSLLQILLKEESCKKYRSSTNAYIQITEYKSSSTNARLLRADNENKVAINVNFFIKTHF